LQNIHVISATGQCQQHAVLIVHLATRKPVSLMLRNSLISYTSCTTISNKVPKTVHCNIFQSNIRTYLLRYETFPNSSTVLHCHKLSGLNSPMGSNFK
jgi:hypothetical protein